MWPGPSLMFLGWGRMGCNGKWACKKDRLLDGIEGGYGSAGAQAPRKGHDERQPTPPRETDETAITTSDRIQAPGGPPRLTRFVFIAWALAAVALTACVEEDALELGSAAAEIQSFGDVLDLASYESTAHLSTAWIGDPLGSAGGILSAFTVLEPGAAGRDVSGDAAYAFMPGPAWYNASSTSTPVARQTWRRWDDPSAPWPAPENLCEVYDCTSGVVPEVRYAAAVSAFSTGYRNIAGVVAVLEVIGPDRSYYEVVVLSSTDGGRTLTNARIVSFGPPNRASFSSGGHERPYTSTVFASTLIRPEEGSRRELSYTAPVYITWKGGGLGDLFGWWLTKIQIDPSTGHIDVLNDPQRLDFLKNDETGLVTVQAWQRWEDGLDTVALLWSERSERDDAMTAVTEFEPCPSNKQYKVEWKYRRATGLFDAGTLGSTDIDPTWATTTETIDVDELFKPCVGPSFSSTPSASPFFVSSDRANIAINRGWPWLSYITYTKTHPELNLARVWLRKIGDPQTYFTPEYSEMPVADDFEEHYNPIVAVHQGNGLDGPQFVLGRMVSLGELVSIRGRSHFWAFSDAATASPWAQEGPTTGVSILGGFGSDENDIAGAFPPNAYDGMTLGLVAMPRCVNDDCYGPCPAGTVTTHPDLFFHAAWGRSNAIAVEGRKFEHL